MSSAIVSVYSLLVRQIVLHSHAKSHQVHLRARKAVCQIMPASGDQSTSTKPDARWYVQKRVPHSYIYTKLLLELYSCNYACYAVFAKDHRLS